MATRSVVCTMDEISPGTKGALAWPTESLDLFGGLIIFTGVGVTLGVDITSNAVGGFNRLQLFTDGSAAAPALFRGTGSFNTGLYYPSATSIAVTCNGTNAATFTTSGLQLATVLAGQYGGTGVANTGKTITVSGNTTIGSSTHTVALATTGNTSITLPTSGTIHSTATDIAVADGGTGASTADSARTNLGVKRSDIVILADEKSAGTNAGTSSAGWNDRTLNTERYDSDGTCTINADNIRFQLAAGTWIIEWTSPIGYDNGRCGSRLYNTTDAAEVAQGRSLYCASGEQNDSNGYAKVTIASAKEFKIQTYHQNGVATEGLGSAKPGGVGTEVYTMVKCVRILE